MRQLMKSIPYMSNLVIVGLLVTLFKIISWMAVFSEWNFSLIVAVVSDLASVLTLMFGIVFILINVFGISIGPIEYDDYIEDDYDEDYEDQ